MAGLSLGSILYYVKAKNEDFKKRMGENKTKIKDLDTQLQKSKANLKKWGTVLTAMSTGALVAFSKMADGSAKTAEQLDKMAKQTGISTEELSKLGYAASQELASIEQLATGLTRLSRNMLDMSNDVGEAKRGFEELEIDVSETDGTLRKADDVLYDIADRFANIQDETRKTGLAMQLFGRSGAELVPFLSLGSEGIKELGKEAEKLGVVLTKDNVSDFRKYKDTLDAVKAGFAGLKMTITKDVLPVLQNIVDGLKSFFQKLNSLPEPLRQIITQGSAFAAVLGLIAGPMLLIIGYLPQIKTGLAMVQGAFTPFLVGGAIIIGLITIFNYFKRIREEAELVKRDVSDVTSLVEVEKQLAAVNKAIEKLDEAEEWEENNDETVKGMGGQYTRYGEKAEEVKEQDKSEKMPNPEREALEKQRELLLEKQKELIKVEEVIKEEQAILETMREKRSQMIIKEISKNDYISFLQDQVANEKWSTETRAQFQLELEAALAASEEEITAEYEKHAETRAEIEKEYQNKRALFGKEGLERELTEIEQQKQAEISRAEEAKMSAEKIAEIEQYWDDVKLAKKQEYKDKTLELEADYLNKLNGLRREELRSELDTLKVQKEDSLITEEEYRDQVKLIRQEMLDLELANIEYQKQKEIQAARESGSGDAIAGIEEYYQTMADAAIKAYEDIEVVEERRRKKAENDRTNLFKENQIEYQYEQGDISSDEYVAYLKNKLEEAKNLYGEWSDEYMAILAKINEEEKKTADEKEQAEERKKRTEENRLQWQYEQGEKSKADYLEHLKKKLADAEQWSDDYIAILQEIQQVEGETTEESKSNWQQFLSDLHAEVQDHPMIQLFSNMGFENTKVGQLFQKASVKLGGMIDDFFSKIFGKGNWVGILMEIIKQTKSFQVAMKILNAFMKPFIGLVDLVLLPLLKFIANIWNAIMDGLSSISIFGWKPFEDLADYKIDLGDEGEGTDGGDDSKDNKPSVNGSQITNLTGASRNFLTDLLRPWRDLTTININIDYIRRSVADIASMLKTGTLASITPAAAGTGGKVWNVKNLEVHVHPATQEIGNNILNVLGEEFEDAAQRRGQT